MTTSHVVRDKNAASRCDSNLDAQSASPTTDYQHRLSHTDTGLFPTSYDTVHCTVSLSLESCLQCIPYFLDQQSNMLTCLSTFAMQCLLASVIRDIVIEHLYVLAKGRQRLIFLVMCIYAFLCFNFVM